MHHPGRVATAGPSGDNGVTDRPALDHPPAGRQSPEVDAAAGAGPLGERQIHVPVIERAQLGGLAIQPHDALDVDEIAMRGRRRKGHTEQCSRALLTLESQAMRRRE